MMLDSREDHSQEFNAMHCLAAEDDPTSGLVLKKLLSQYGKCTVVPIHRGIRTVYSKTLLL
jgi:hypothetical protein